MLTTSHRRSQRLNRLLQKAQAALEAAQRKRFRYESSRKWRVTLLRHRIQRIKEALGIRTTGVGRKPSYRVGEAAQFLSISPRTLHRWVARGRLQHERSPGGHLRIAHREIARIKMSRRPPR